MSSIFLAQFIGIYLMIKATGILIQAKNLGSIVKEFEQNRALEVVVSAIAVFIGLMLVLLHNEWGTIWQGCISLFGWGLLLKGVLMLWLPKKMYRVAHALNDPAYFRIGAVVLYIIGIYLLYSAY